MNPLSKSKLTYFHSLQRKKYRYQYRQILLEGWKLVREGLASSWEMTDLILTDPDQLSLLPEPLEELAVWLADPQTFKQLSTQVSPEGVMGVARMPASYFQAEEPSRLPVGPGIILDQLQDPGNVGTILRTADWFGLKQVIFTPGTVDPFNPKVLRASMGSIFRVNICTVSSVLTWSEQEQEIWIADLSGANLHEVKLGAQAYVVLGNEARGVSPDIKTQSSWQRVKIPGELGAESLNASMAGTIWAWEWYRQQITQKSINL